MGRSAVNRKSLSLCLVLVMPLLFWGCGSSSDAEAADAGPMAEPDMRRPSTPPPAPPRSDWTKGVIEGDGSGLQPSIAARPDGRVGVAYFKTSPIIDGECSEIGGDGVPMRKRWPVRFAELTGDTWQIETVHEPLLLGNPAGLSFAYAPDGTPVVSTMTGEPLEMFRYCGANDVGVLTKDGDEWSLETAVTSSGEAATGMPGSDFGEVVGYWPALAFDNEGNPGVAYRDVHAGSIQGDDLTRADMEFAHRRGGWSTVAVDAGEGAGEYNQLLFDAQNRAVILYHNPVEQTSDRVGLWLARAGAEPDSWEEHRIFDSKTTPRPSIALDPNSNTLVIAFYNPLEGRPYLARQDSAESITEWSFERLGDDRYNEGIHPSVAFDPEGKLAIAWYRCNRVGTGGACDPVEDALVFWWDADGEWIKEVVDTGDNGECGYSPVLAFDAEGRAVVAYQCLRGMDEESAFELDYARRKILR